MNAHVKMPAATTTAPAPSLPAEAPRVPVRRVRHWSGVYLLIFTEPCPYCGRKHTHGGGRIPNDPSVLGHRIPHCADPLPSQRRRLGTVAEFRERSRRGYYLVEADEPK